MTAAAGPVAGGKNQYERRRRDDMIALAARGRVRS